MVDDDIEIPLLDYRDVVSVPLLWSTDAWEEATWLIDFYAEGDEKEIRRYEAGLPKLEDFIAAGWTEVPTPPSVTGQLADDGVDMDSWKNAGIAFRSAASAYARGQTEPEALRDAVLNGFQAVELVLKMRLESIDKAAIKANNPTILRRLTDEGVSVSSSEITTIDELRQLRNKLQHAGATFGYRQTRRLLRAAFAFLDRFVHDELDLWINHVCDPEGWRALLKISSIEANAEKISEQIAARARDDPAVSVTICDACGRDRMVLLSEVYGDCLYCRAERREVAKD